MGVSGKIARRQPDAVAQLRAQVEALSARLEALEASPRVSPNGSDDGGRTGNHHGPQSRRDLLKLAGAAAAGAAGTVLLRSVPAAAINNQPVLLGNSTTNDAGTTTDLFPTTATFPSPLLQATGQGVDPTTTVTPTISTTAPTTQSIPLIGAIGAGGILPVIGTSPADYPGFAPIQGVGGKATVNGSPVSEGLNGWGGGKSGMGVTGESDSGFGVVGGSGGIDLAALGAGRILQLSLPNDLLLTPPTGPPKYNNPNDFEQVRDARGILWLSGAGGTWRRANTLRFDTPVGTAAFAPIRIIDTRDGTGTAGSGLTPGQPLQPGVTYTFGPFSGLPIDAIGIVGNLTAAGFTGAGFITIFPAGVAVPGTASVNFSPPFASSGWGNAFAVGFGTGANARKISLQLSNNGITSHAVVDVTAYVQ